MENVGGKKFTNAILMPVKAFVTAPGCLKNIRKSMIRRVHVCVGSSGGHFENFFVNFDLINNNNSTDT
jgi:hypothetical protein